MEQDSFPHPAIRAHAERSFIPVKLRSDVNEELALGFGLSGLPATVIVAPSREVFVVRQGYLGPDELGTLLGEATERHTTEQERTRQIASAKASERVQEERQPKSKTNTKTKMETHVALSGYCPVSLVSDRKLVQGQAEYTVTHEGRLYRFANMLTFNLFRRDPERFVPVNNGNCPVTQVELGKQQPGNPSFGVLYQGRLYPLRDRRRPQTVLLIARSLRCRRRRRARSLPPLPGPERRARPRRPPLRPEPGRPPLLVPRPDPPRGVSVGVGRVNTRDGEIRRSFELGWPMRMSAGTPSSQRACGSAARAFPKHTLSGESVYSPKVDALEAG